MQLHELLQQIVTGFGANAGANPVQQAFAKHPKIPVEEFVRLMADAITEMQTRQGYAEMVYRQLQQQKQQTGPQHDLSSSSCSRREGEPCASTACFTDSQDSAEGAAWSYLTLKKRLFVVHGEMDTDRDGLVTHEDFVDYLLDSRKRQLGVVLGEIPSFEVAKTLSFRSLHGSGAEGDDLTARRPSSAVSGGYLKQRRRSSAAPSSVSADDEQQLLQFDPIVKLKALRGGRKLFAIGRMQRTGFISVDSHTVQSELAQPLAGTTCRGGGEALGLGFSSAVRWPTGRVLDADLLSQEPVLVTSHRDKAVVLWKERSVVLRSSSMSGALQHALGDEVRQWVPFYDFGCEYVQTVVSAHPTTDIVFTGGTQGDVKMWHLGTELIADFTRGERTALARISARSWAPGERHNGSISGIAYLRQGARVVSAAMDATLAEYDVEKEHVVTRYIHTSGIHFISASVHLPDFVIGCGFGSSPCLWDLNASSDKPLLLSDFADPHRQALVGVSEIGGSMPLLVSCDATSKIKIWDLRMMSCLQTIVADREGLNEATKLATGTSNSHASDSAGGNDSSSSKVSLCNLRVPLATSMATTSTGTIAVTGRVFSLVESNTTRMTIASRHQQRPVIGSVFDSAANCLLTLHADCVVRWESGAPRSSFRLALKNKNRTAAAAPVPTCIALDPRGRNYLIGATDGVVRAFKIATGETIGAAVLGLKTEVRALSGFAAPGSLGWTLVAVGVDGCAVYLSDKAPAPRPLPMPGNSGAVTCAAVHNSLVVVGTNEGLVLGLSTSSQTALEQGPTFTYCVKGSESVTCVEVVVRLGLAVIGTSGGSFVIVNLHRAGEVLREVDLPGKIASLARASSSLLASSMGSSVRPSRPTPIASIAALFFSGISWLVFCGLDDGQIVVYRIERTVLSDDLEVRDRAVALLAHHGALLHDSVVSIAAAGSIAFASSLLGETVALSLEGRCLGSLVMTRQEPLELTTNIRVAQVRDASVIDHVHRFLAALKRRAVLRALTRRNAHRPGGLLVSAKSIARFESSRNERQSPPVASAAKAADEGDGKTAEAGLSSPRASSPRARLSLSSPQTPAFRRLSANPAASNRQNRRDTVGDDSGGMDLEEMVGLAPRVHNPILKVQPPPRPVTAAARGTLPLRLRGPQPLVPSRDCVAVPHQRAPSLHAEGTGGIGGISSLALQLLAQRLPASQMKSLRGAAGSSVRQAPQHSSVVLGGQKVPPGGASEVSPRGFEHALLELSKVEAEKKAARLAPKRPHTARR
jgi:WD40 repeat protein